MENFKKYIILLLSIIFVTVITIGISYSYYTFLLSSQNSDLATSGNLEVIYLSGEDIEGNLFPSLTKDSGLYTSSSIKLSSNSVNALATLTLNIEVLPTVLAVEGLKWEVYENGNSIPINQGTFEGVNEGDKLIIVDDYLLSANETIFTLYIWLNGNEVGNEVQNQEFRALLGASATTK